jgi:hypothetical protein
MKPEEVGAAFAAFRYDGKACKIEVDETIELVARVLESPEYRRRQWGTTLGGFLAGWEAAFASPTMKCMREVVADRLRTAMSNVSETCWAAGWLNGLEFDLWRFVQDGPGEYGMGTIAQSDIDELRNLSELCGGWFQWNDGKGATFMPMDEWIKNYEGKR